MSTQARWKLPLVIGVSAVLVAVLFEVMCGKASEEVPPRGVAAQPTPARATPPRPAAPVLGAAQGSQAEPLDRFLLANPDGESQGAPASDYPVKMDELRKKLPDSLYWELDAPTQDPEVLARRAEAQRKWNEVFGKIQSGDATEEEIHRYYDHRKKLSEDYIAVANLMLTESGDKLPESDKGLIELSIRMHQDRLKEVPRQVDEALARKQLQDRRREEWIRNGKKP
jgi:hypothetical protein